MRSLAYILIAFSSAMLVFAALRPSLLLVVLLLACAFYVYVLTRLLYRPPENHVGAIYRLGRLWQLVDPDDWAVLLPFVDQIRAEVSWHLRTLHVALADLLTRDRVPIDCELRVHYRIDLRAADPRLRSEALGLLPKDWESLIETMLRELAGQVFGGRRLWRLVSAEGRRELKRALSTRLANDSRGLGLIISPVTGVSVQELRPADQVWRALADHSAAIDLGHAARDRVRPLLDELSGREKQEAWDALLLAWTASAVREGSQPEIVMASGDGPGRDGITSQGSSAIWRAIRQSLANGAGHDDHDLLGCLDSSSDAA